MYAAYRRRLVKWLKENEWQEIMDELVKQNDPDVSCEVCHGYGDIYFTYGASEFGNFVCMGCLTRLRSDEFIPAPITGPLRIRFHVLKRDGFRCQYCGRGPKDGATLQVDHIIPKAHGGSDTMDNLVTACWECNMGKSDILLDIHEQRSKTK